MSSTLSNLLPKITALESEYSEAIASLATATKTFDVISNSRLAATLEVTIAYLSNEEILQTATNSEVVASASAAASAATAALTSLYQADNLYGMTPSYGGNMAMAIVMGVFFAVHSALGLWYQQWWFFVSYFTGAGLEMAGYVGRTLSNNDVTNLNYFLLQIIALTIAPVFIMAGIYFLLAQLIMIYGTKFALLKPMYYSYIFISCDVISLVIQAAGGGIAATALTVYESPDSGTHVMVAGLAFQVFSMSVFIFLFGDFLRRIKFGTKGHKNLEPFFNPRYASLRSRKLFGVFPIAIGFGVLFVYVRCIYRVVELAEGWTGYLITHEVYFMILDALMMALACVLFIAFHPGVVYGKGEHIAIDGFKKHKKLEADDYEGKDVELGKLDETNINSKEDSPRWKGVFRLGKN